MGAKWAVDNLQTIRSLMERSALYCRALVARHELGRHHRNCRRADRMALPNRKQPSFCLPLDDHGHHFTRRHLVTHAPSGIEGFRTILVAADPPRLSGFVADLLCRFGDGLSHPGFQLWFRGRGDSTFAGHPLGVVLWVRRPCGWLFYAAEYSLAFIVVGSVLLSSLNLKTSLNQLVTKSSKARNTRGCAFRRQRCGPR